ncbi:hypothetical protein LH61_06390 [Leuconostoc mesenteroides P45]|uniref:MFS transporter n=1 Tax=Leuconostoc mesenteroides TaxID=1245 RepID=UPI000502E6B2|nr:MFS transporter [Leuconostoc mesenteroides]KGB51099.1 hypothetical protein LH61_06390 [Leuconostoc mesenteroides P45]
MEENKISRKTIGMIIATALMGFAGIMSETAMNVTFPKLMNVFHVSIGAMQWVTTIYLLAVAIIMTMSSYIQRRFTEKKIFYTSIIIFTVGTLVGGLSQDFVVLLVGRVLQGTAAGLAMPLMFNIIFERVPMNQLGLWMGFASMILSLAPSLGPTYGGLMIESFGWRMIFIFTLAIPLLALLIAIPSYENSKKTPLSKPFDFIAFILLAITLTALLIAVNELESGHVNYLLFGTFIITLGLFIWRSLTSQAEFLNIRIFRKLSFTMAIIPFILFQFMNIGGNFIIPNYLQLGFGVSSALAGFALLPGTLLGAFFSPLFGKVYDHKGAKLPLYGGTVALLGSLILMFVLVQTMGFWFTLLLYILFTLGRVLAFGTTNTTAVAHLSNKERSDGSAMFQTAQQFAGALGTTVVALIVGSNKDIKVGMNHTLLLFVILSLIILVMYRIMFKTKEYTE